MILLLPGCITDVDEPVGSAEVATPGPTAVQMGQTYTLDLPPAGAAAFWVNMTPDAWAAEDGENRAYLNLDLGLENDADVGLVTTAYMLNSGVLVPLWLGVGAPADFDNFYFYSEEPQFLSFLFAVGTDSPDSATLLVGLDGSPRQDLAAEGAETLVPALTGEGTDVAYYYEHVELYAAGYRQSVGSHGADVQSNRFTDGPVKGPEMTTVATAQGVDGMGTHESYLAQRYLNSAASGYTWYTLTVDGEPHAYEWERSGARIRGPGSSSLLALNNQDHAIRGTLSMEQSAETLLDLRRVVEVGDHIMLIDATLPFELADTGIALNEGMNGGKAAIRTPAGWLTAGADGLHVGEAFVHAGTNVPQGNA